MAITAIKQITPEFIPEGAYQDWDDVEVHPVIDLGDGVCQVCEEEEASFWSVYLHLKEGGLSCVADLPTAAMAYRVAELINFSSLSRKP